MRFFIEQLALCPTDPGRARALLEKMGMQDWATDTVKARGTVWGVGPYENTAQLSFNYQATDGGDKALELEILDYTKGAAWVDEFIGNDQSIVSHLGMHCTAADRERWIAFFKAEGIEIVQDVLTLSHTNPAIAGKRWYTYTIFGTRDILGVDIKLIVRMGPGK